MASDNKTELIKVFNQIYFPNVKWSVFFSDQFPFFVALNEKNHLAGPNSIMVSPRRSHVLSIPLFLFVQGNGTERRKTMGKARGKILWKMLF